MKRWQNFLSAMGANPIELKDVISELTARLTPLMSKLNEANRI